MFCASSRISNALFVPQSSTYARRHCSSQLCFGTSLVSLGMCRHLKNKQNFSVTLFNNAGREGVVNMEVKKEVGNEAGATPFNNVMPPGKYWLMLKPAFLVDCTTTYFIHA